MLLNVVVIVLRETLEAGVLIAVLLSVSRKEGIGCLWLLPALLIGSAGAVVYALNLGPISESFDYVGQEVLNAMMQYIIYSLLVVIIAMQFFRAPESSLKLWVFIIAAVAIAVVREGGELFVFYAGLLQSQSSLLNAVTSGFIGLAVGVSVGAICYYSLVSQPLKRARALHATVLTLVAGGMAVQANQMLIQADWLSAGQPLWNSNGVLAESSVMGQIVYAVFGYEATPSMVEVVGYVFALALVAVVLLIRARFFRALLPEKAKHASL